MSKKNNNFDENLEYILKEMCSRVGRNYDDVDFNDDTWYLTSSWTKKDQDSFTKWLTNYLYNNKEAREALLRFPLKDKNRIENAANEFVFNYGWKVFSEDLV